jgi:hypothetical protein
MQLATTAIKYFLLIVHNHKNEDALCWMTTQF